MEEKKHIHPLVEVWNSFSDVQETITNEIKIPTIEKSFSEIFGIGKYYYYVLNLTDSSVSRVHKNILKTHGLKDFPIHLKEIIDLIHPDDVPFVVKAEKVVVEVMNEIGKEFQLYLKPSYCFRMKTAKGSYELFHHQAFHTLENENKQLIQSINIHTNIQHITKENPHTVLITGIKPRKDFIQIKVDNDLISPILHENELTKRENEVLKLIAKGYSGKEISDILVLSEHTIRTHRRNILNKTQCRNSRELVKWALDLGLV